MARCRKQFSEPVVSATSLAVRVKTLPVVIVPLKSAPWTVLKLAVSEIVSVAPEFVAEVYVVALAEVDLIVTTAPTEVAVTPECSSLCWR